MVRALPSLLIALLLAAPLAAPAPARAQGMGLDLSDDEPPKPKPARKKRAPRRKEPPKPPPPPPAAPAPAARPAPPRPAPKAPFPGLGLDLSEDAAGPEARAYQGVPGSGKPADRTKLDAARLLFDQGAHPAASVALAALLADPDAAELHEEAQYLLAKSLYRQDLHHASLVVFREVLRRGESSRFFRSSLEWLFFIAHRTVSETAVLDEIARHAAADWPERQRGEFRYLLAKREYGRGKSLLDAAEAVDEEQAGMFRAEATRALEESRKLAMLVPRDSRFWPRARYVDGLALYASGQYQPALEAFKDVVRATNPKVGQLRDEDLREQAFMQLARIHYEHRQNRYATHYYDRIPRGARQWLASLYESAWAHFRLGQYERALGNMITLHSPFFRDEYFPEALILKSVIYYENCRYPEALRLVKEYEQRYEPLRKELDRMLARRMEGSEGWYRLLDSIQRSAPEDATHTDRLLGQVLKLALSDKDLEHQNLAIRELAAERERLEGGAPELRDSKLAKDLIEALDDQRADLEQKAGFYARRKLEREQAALADLSYRALAIRAEVGTQEKELLEASLRGGNAEVELESYRYSTAVDDEHVYWPYEGEYWRDELGTYQYTLTRGCREK